MNPSNDLWGMDQVQAFISLYPELNSSDIELLERFQVFYQSQVDIEAMKAQDKVEGLHAAVDALRALMESVQAVRIAETKKGAVEQAWLNQAESDQIKKVFMKNIDLLYGTDLQNLIVNGN